MASCDTHPFDQADDSCRECKRSFCATCLVYSFGPKKPPYCVPCALTAAGVRRGGPKARRGIFA
jgi:hypothetical protein